MAATVSGVSSWVRSTPLISAPQAADSGVIFMVSRTVAMGFSLENGG